jgi:cytochrome bd-type quinol oxidase subunit 1
MGAVRELARQDWHVFNVLKDTTPQAFTSPLAQMSLMVGIVTLLFFAFMAFIFWIGFVLSGREEEMA